MPRRKRKPTVCEACGFPSYNGRVCKGCKTFWGGDADNCIRAAALSIRCRRARTLEDVFAIFNDLADAIVVDWCAGEPALRPDRQHLVSQADPGR